MASSITTTSKRFPFAAGRHDHLEEVDRHAGPSRGTAAVGRERLQAGGPLARRARTSRSCSWQRRRRIACRRGDSPMNACTGGAPSNAVRPTPYATQRLVRGRTASLAFFGGRYGSVGCEDPPGRGTASASSHPRRPSWRTLIQQRLVADPDPASASPPPPPSRTATRCVVLLLAGQRRAITDGPPRPGAPTSCSAPPAARRRAHAPRRRSATSRRQQQLLVPSVAPRHRDLPPAHPHHHQLHHGVEKNNIHSRPAAIDQAAARRDPRRAQRSAVSPSACTGPSRRQHTSHGQPPARRDRGARVGDRVVDAMAVAARLDVRRLVEVTRAGR